jgi:hypothetical protein
MSSIEVGKVITCKANNHTPFGPISEESVGVSMGENGISLDVSQHADVRALLHPLSPTMLTAEQAIELGQMLLKAAECQSEYAEAVKLLNEEKAKLATKYKDMISGLGLDSVVDVVDARGTFQVIESS